MHPRLGTGLVAAAMVCLLIPPTFAQSTEPALAWDEIHPAPAEGGREFVELRNDGAAIDLEGWIVEDAVGNRFTFPPWTVAQGARVVVWGGGDDDGRGPAWSKSTAWNNGGDTVRLLMPDGTLVASMQYGTPAVPAPQVGQSLQWDGDWATAEPSPGTPPGAQGGNMGATVEDMPPDVTLSGPAQAIQGDTVDLSLEVIEPNGQGVVWTLQDATGVLLQGDGPAATQWVGPAPSAGSWQVALVATDEAGQATQANLSIEVLASRLTITLPPEGLAFPSLRPGMAVAATEAWLTLQNVGSTPITPRMDVADLTGPDRIPARDHVQIGLRDGAGGWAWSSYEGPFMWMPSLEGGASMDVRFRLVDLPIPLAAGDYGTSFAVVT